MMPQCAMQKQVSPEVKNGLDNAGNYSRTSTLDRQHNPKTDNLK
jgi:hypothetical protein